VTVAETVAEGMRTLLIRRDEQLAHGATSVGWKIGLNGTAVQQLFGLEGPVVGYLTDRTVLEPGTTVDISRWMQPALEVEVAIRVGDDGKVAGIAPALELVDLGGFFDDIGQMLAANICHRGVIFGPELSGFAIEGLEVQVVNASGEERATGALVEDPAITVRVVHDFLAAHGATLTAGDRIIAGSLITPVPISQGEALTISFGELGQLSVSFA
jgi:2-keto-4-pentenoate hydratase